MGKDLRGKELGKGLRQRTDGKYIARYSCRNGKRPEKAFEKLGSARIWLEEQRYLDKNNEQAPVSAMTVDEWESYWIDNIKKPSIRETTYRGYCNRYKCGIKPLLGNMLVADVKPLDCQAVLNDVIRKHSQGTAEQVRICMQQIFTAAAENGLIPASPVTRSVKLKKGEKQERRVLTVAEQKKFVDYIQKTNHRYARQYMLCLETGMRAGELTGLQWQDIKDGKINVSRTVSILGKELLYENTPKTRAGRRSIPLTSRAKRILKDCHNGTRKETLAGFSDASKPAGSARLTPGGRVVKLGYVFHRDGEPINYANLDRALKTVCKKLKMEPFTMHSLRHTFATRCIEAEMKPKTLQYILGHSRIEMTMNLYVHVTDETVIKEMEKFELAI